MRPLLIDDIAKAQAEQGVGFVVADRTPIQLGTPGPWRVVMASIVRANTGLEQTRLIVPALFGAYTSVTRMENAEWPDVSKIMQYVKQRHRRARQMVEFSRQLVKAQWRDLRELSGMTLYIADCVGLFCFGDTNLEAGNAELERYVEVLQRSANKAGRDTAADGDH